MNNRICDLKDFNRIRNRKTRMKWRHQRCERGFADCDLWNFNSFLLEMIPNALDKFAERATGWPGGSQQFGKFEDYQDYIKEIARDIRAASKEMYWDDTEEFTMMFREKNFSFDEELKTLMKIHYDNGCKNLKESFIKLADLMPCLWD